MPGRPDAQAASPPRALLPPPIPRLARAKRSTITPLLIPQAPSFSKHTLDVAKLYRLVQENGGYDEASWDPGYCPLNLSLARAHPSCSRPPSPSLTPSCTADLQAEEVGGGGAQLPAPREVRLRGCTLGGPGQRPAAAAAPLGAPRHHDALIEGTQTSPPTSSPAPSLQHDQPEVRSAGGPPAAAAGDPPGTPGTNRPASAPLLCIRLLAHPSSPFTQRCSLLPRYPSIAAGT